MLIFIIGLLWNQNPNMMPRLYSTKRKDVFITSDGYKVTMTQLNEEYKLRRKTRFESSGCACCWHHCSCDKPFLP